jgi:D-alanine-D-alanine ligase
MEYSTAPGESPRKPRVAVVFGGRSSEHGISCLTAGSVLQAIDREGYDVVPVGITQDGRWVLESAEPSRLAITGDDRLPQVDGGATPLVWTGSRHDAAAAELIVQEPASVPQTLGEVDVVFPLLHGPWGEDGTLQGFLEMAGVRYVGAGVLASAVGMDKHYMKVVLQAAGLPVLPSVVIRPERWKNDQAGCIAGVEALGYPVFVKPARGGSSIGISQVHDRSELGEAVELAQRHDPKVLVEPAAVSAPAVRAARRSRRGPAPRRRAPRRPAPTGSALPRRPRRAGRRAP